VDISQIGRADGPGSRWESWIARLEDDERSKTGISGLKVGYNRVFGYYIEVSSSQKSKVPDYYTPKQTLSNSERYISPPEGV
jgi:DNA mismatch repair protein MutS